MVQLMVYLCVKHECTLLFLVCTNLVLTCAKDVNQCTYLSEIHKERISISQPGISANSGFHICLYK